MSFEIYRFQMRQPLTAPRFWFTAPVFCAIASSLASTDAVISGCASGNVWRNAPLASVKRMRKFLKYELDACLAGRGTEKVAEERLAKVKKPAYFDYREGSRGLPRAGLARPSRAQSPIKEVLQASGNQAPPLTTSPKLMDIPGDATGSKWKPLLAD